MIELRKVSVEYGPRLVLRDVDLAVPEGVFVLVAGRTGVGKSTLLGTFNGLVPTFTGGRLTGDVVVDGASVVDRPPRERVETVGYVGQDPSAGFVTDTVEEELAYGMEQLGLPASTMRRRVEETLDLLGIAGLRRRNLRTLSDGEQQRVAIGSVLTMHPRVLVLDEPTSALDPTAAEDVLATLSRLVHDVGMSVVLAEHRLERVVPFADLMVLVTGDDGAVVSGDPAEMLRSAPVAPPIVELGRAAGWKPLPLTVRDARRQARHLSLPLPVAATTDDVEPAELVARGVSVAHGQRAVLREVDVALPRASVTALMGRNGAGKSTLLWALQGSGRRDAGSVTVAGEDPAEATPALRRRLVGLVPQAPADLLYLETVAEECETADGDAEARLGSTRALLDRLVPGIDPGAHPRDLSEGQRLALVLAVVLVSKPRVLLLDEPTRGLDYPGKEALGRMLQELAEEGTTVLLATHDVEFVAAVAQHAVVLADGEVVSAGAAAAVLGETPAFAPQVHKVLGPGWLTVDQVIRSLAGAAEYGVPR